MSGNTQGAIQTRGTGPSRFSSNEEGTSRMRDFGIHSRLYSRKDGGGHGSVILEIDDTDHFSIIHEQCKGRMDIRVERPQCGGEPGLPIKVLWFQVRCVECNTKWTRWRKNSLMGRECRVPKKALQG